MTFREAHMIEFDLFNSLWFLYCNEKIGSSTVEKYIEGLDIELEFITLSGYKFTSKDKKTTYSYGKQTTKKSH
jgi:hypothetical protein